MNKQKISIIFLSLAITMVVSGCAGKNENNIKPEVVNNQIQEQSSQSLTSTSFDNIATNTEDIASSSEEIKYLPNGEIDNSAWNVFDSHKDSGTKLHFTLKYPKTWVNEGSIDGGMSSSLPFYDKERYSQSCYKERNNSMRCNTAGKIFEIIVSSPTKNYRIPEKSHTEKIDEYMGYIEEKSAENKDDDESLFVNNEVIVCTIPSVEGTKFEIIMAKSATSSVSIFDEILKSVKFLN